MLKLKPFLFATTLAVTATVASAASYTQVHLDGLGYEHLSQGETYQNTFDLGLAANEVVDWAKLSFAFADDALLGDASFDWFGKTIWLGDPNETVQIVAGAAEGQWEVEGNILWYHWIFISNQDLIDSLNAWNGVLNYSVAATQGDFYLKEVVLCATTEITPPAVPDTASTAGLLALALVGCAGLARRRKL